jgi:DNA-binding NtrC family response regulator
MVKLDNYLAGKFILFVEDDPTIKRFLEIATKNTGATVFVAGSVGEANSILDDGIVPDVLISDLHLPDGLGESVRARAAALGSATAVYTADASRKTIRSIEVDIWDKRNFIGIKTVTMIVELLRESENKKTGS